MKYYSSDLDIICALEQVEENRQFILPYEKVRHQQVIENPYEFHLSISMNYKLL